MAKNPVYHARMKHINNKYNHIRSLVGDGVMKLHYLPTYEQVESILTKVLPNKKLGYLRGKIGLVDISSLIERE